MEHLELCEICGNLAQIEEPCEGLYDLTLEAQVQFLEFTKRFKDCERGKCKGKGFANTRKLNPDRNPKVFTYLEAEFNRLANDCDLTLEHEVRIKVRDRVNHSHIFKLDFLETTTRINVEVSPNWHKNYLLVARRDALRKRLLKQVGIRSLTVPVVHKCGQLHIDVVRAKRVIKIILNAKTSPNSLDFYSLRKTQGR